MFVKKKINTDEVKPYVSLRFYNEIFMFIAKSIDSANKPQAQFKQCCKQLVIKLHMWKLNCSSVSRTSLKSQTFSGVIQVPCASYIQ